MKKNWDLNKWKASGTDEISNLTENLGKLLLGIFQNLINQGSLPIIRKEKAYIDLLYKKESLQRPFNYRAVSLTSVLVSNILIWKTDKVKTDFEEEQHADI